MKKAALGIELWGLWALSLLFSPAVLAGGGWGSSGGGSTVACFPSSETAAQADLYLNQGEILPDGLLADAKFSVLEHWELEQTNQPVAKYPLTASRADILQNVMSEVDFSFPLFADRLRASARLIDFSTWQSACGVEGERAYHDSRHATSSRDTQLVRWDLVEDANPMVALPGNCRRVQVVIRLSNGNNKMGDGPTVHQPELKVVYASKYFDRLSPLDQAMLILHEDLYVLGQAIGHPTSDIIRGFVRILFLQSWHESRFQYPPYELDPTTLHLKQQLVRGFGDYIHYFAADEKPQPGLPFTPRHQFYTFMTLAGRLSDRMGQCLKTGLDPVACKEKVMSPLPLQTELSPEEAFVYAADFGLEQSLGGFNADSVMTPEGESPELFSKAMQMACRRISEEFPVNLAGKALEYCAAWRASHF